MTKKKKEKTYLVAYMTECDGDPVVERMTVVKIKERFGDYPEEVAIIDGEILKGFDVKRWPREILNDMKKGKIMDIREAVAKLEECCSLEGTEVGESWQALLGLWYRRDYIDSEFAKILEVEVIKAGEDIEQHWRIVEEETTITQTNKYLEYFE